MPAPKIAVGELRPSQMEFSYGIGALVDLPNLSVLLMGLDDWDQTKLRRVTEERLLAEVRRSCGPQVDFLAQPPVIDDGMERGSDEDATGVPVATFPGWLVCPHCRLLAPIEKSVFQLKPSQWRPEMTRYVHQLCAKTDKPRAAIPVRFIVACSNGSP